VRQIGSDPPLVDLGHLHETEIFVFVRAATLKVLKSHPVEDLAHQLLVDDLCNDLFLLDQLSSRVERCLVPLCEGSLGPGLATTFHEIS
jgi:hypothetical protein